MATEYFFGHRGYDALFPENTLLAFRKAIEAGANGFELDVARSADGMLFCMHDDSVNRTTNGKGECAELSWDYIRTLDAGSYKDAVFAGEKVPSLEEVLDYFKDVNCWILVEIKNGYGDIASDVAGMITEKEMEDQVKVQSFNWDYMDTVKAINRAICTGLLGTRASTAQTRALYSRHDFISLNSCNQETVSAARAEGLETFIWTVNRADDMRECFRLGVEGIIGDNVLLMMEAAEENNMLQSFPFVRPVPVFRRKVGSNWAKVSLEKGWGGDWVQMAPKLL